MNTQQTELLLASPSLIRKMASQIREKNIPYQVERVEFKNYNSSWRGYKGLGLRVAIDDYEKLFQHSN